MQSIILDSYFIQIHTNNCNPYAMSSFIFSNRDLHSHSYYLLNGIDSALSSSAPDLSLSILKHDAQTMRIDCDIKVYVLRSFYGLFICPVMTRKLDCFQCRFLLDFIYLFNLVTMQYNRIFQLERHWIPLDIILTPIINSYCSHMSVHMMSIPMGLLISIESEGTLNSSSPNSS